MSAGTAIAIDLVVVCLTIGGLYVGAGRLVAGAVAVSERLGLSELVIGLTIVAVGTSAPELVVTLDAAVEGQASIAMGNVVGSNVFNLGLILGGIALLGPVTVPHRVVSRDGLVLLAVGAVTTAFVLDLQLGRIEGLALVAVWIGYVGLLVRSDANRTRERPETVPLPSDPTDHWEGVVSVLQLVGGLVVVVASAHFLVTSAADLARLVGLSEWAIGNTVVAVGTSTPELATAVIATRRDQQDVSAGSLLGSDLTNVTLGLGGAAVLAPLEVSSQAPVGVGLLALTVAVVVVLAWTDAELTRPEGAVIVAFALGRWIVAVT
ncbi:calcium/sodium antiporter [Halorientalis brevis]|uniref:Calcium/sodium antiporter n=1 Tax=Halorientalis brevis TaxID=1126241 RepID=A0ABD6CDB6_9EURY|nr:calcium/sodium antiporter [Halorientalis brevis]